jgi:uncharacterized protein YheU (UPF0270 family)
VPWSALTDDALRGVAESFVLREGTDYGAIERSFEAKVNEVLARMRRGEARIWFDPVTGSVTLRVKEEPVRRSSDVGRA